MKINLDIAKLLKRIGLTFVALCTFYYVFLLCAYFIPSRFIMDNWHESVNSIASETKRWEVIPNIVGTKLDTFTDNLIFQKLHNNDRLNPFQAAVWNNGYFRYWMGDIPILRFLLVFMSYTGIRYLNIFVIFGLFVAVMHQLQQTISSVFAGLFALVLFMIHFWIFPLSLQYTPVYVILMVAILWLTWMKKQDKLNLNNVVFTSFVIGSVTNYFDLLTAPLLTFAIPFFVWYVLRHQNEIAAFLTVFTETIFMGLAWLLGYAGTWVAKWAVGSIILQENLFQSAIKQIFLRTSGTEGEVLAYSEILKKVLGAMFPTYVWPILLFVMIALVIVGVLSKGFTMHKLLNHSVLLMMSAVPFVWFFILQNHNQHHYYFTYRNLAITVLGIFTYLYVMIDWAKWFRRS